MKLEQRGGTRLKELYKEIPNRLGGIIIPVNNSSNNRMEDIGKDTEEEEGDNSKEGIIMNSQFLAD